MDIEELRSLHKLVEINDHFFGFQFTEKIIEDKAFHTLAGINTKIYGDFFKKINWKKLRHGKSYCACFSTDKVRIDAIIGTDGYIVCAFSFNNERLIGLVNCAPNDYVQTVLFTHLYTDYHDRTFCDHDFELDGQKKVIVNTSATTGIAVPQELVYDLCDLLDSLHEGYMEVTSRGKQRTDQK